MIIGFIINILLCFLVASYWKKKGQSYAAGFFVSFFLTVLVGFLIGLILKRKD